MDVGSFTSGLLTGLREGVEAALIVGIILAYLAQTGNRRHFGRILVGTAAAVAVSLVAGVALFVTIGEFQAPYEQVFEGLTMLLAAGVVTWMLFWMRRQSALVKGELHAALDKALIGGSVVGLTAPGVHLGHPRGPGDVAVPRGAGDVRADGWLRRSGRRRRRPGHRRADRDRLLPWRAGDQSPDLLPLDRDRADLHRRGPAVPRGPRVRRDRLDHRRRVPARRPLRGPAARGDRRRARRRRPPPGRAPVGAVRLHVTARADHPRCVAGLRGHCPRRCTCGRSRRPSSSWRPPGRARRPARFRSRCAAWCARSRSVPVRLVQRRRRGHAMHPRSLSRRRRGAGADRRRGRSGRPRRRPRSRSS